MFAAGADISEFPNFDPNSARAFATTFNDSLLAVEQLPQVTISAVNGYALGGGLEVALTTDFRMMADDGRIGVPEIQLGLIPGGGGTQRLARLAGVTFAKEMVYTGRHVGAEEDDSAQPTSCSVSRQRWTVLLGSSTSRASSESPTGCRRATPSSTRNAETTLVVAIFAFRGKCVLRYIVRSTS